MSQTVNSGAFLELLKNEDIACKNVSFHKKALLEWAKELRRGSWNEIQDCLEDVTKRCNEIEYDDNQVFAYVLLHFLDRYYRSWVTYEYLLEKKMLPLKDNIRLMDIGTGPGPSQYAYSDLLMASKMFSGSDNSQTQGDWFVNRGCTFDYAEKSLSFREFLHYYSEILLKKGCPTYVPFHHGTYYDAEELDFKGKIVRYEYSPWAIRTINLRVKQSYNIIIYSNFLTTEDAVDHYREQIKRGAFYLKNKGIILIISGDPDSPKYKPIYEKIDKIINETKYATRLFKGSCTKVLGPHPLNYSRQCNEARIIADFHKNVFENMEQSTEEALPDCIAEGIKKEIEGIGQEKWWITVYKRFSRFRGQIHL